MDYLALQDTLDREYPLAPRLRAKGLRLTQRGWRVYLAAKQAGDVAVLVLACASLWALVIIAGAR